MNVFNLFITITYIIKVVKVAFWGLSRGLFFSFLCVVSVALCARPLDSVEGVHERVRRAVALQPPSPDLDFLAGSSAQFGDLPTSLLHGSVSICQRRTP